MTIHKIRRHFLSKFYQSSSPMTAHFWFLSIGKFKENFDPSPSKLSTLFMDSPPNAITYVHVSVYFMYNSPSNGFKYFIRLLALRKHKSKTLLSFQPILPKAKLIYSKSRINKEAKLKEMLWNYPYFKRNR